MNVTCVSFFAQRGFAFGRGGAGERAARLRDGVEEDDVAVLHGEDAAMRVVPLRAGAAAEAASSAAATGGRRRELALVVGQLARLAAVAGDHPGGRFLVFRLPPLEIEPLRVARPAQAGRRIAHQLRPLHDAVDAQREGPGGARAGLALGRRRLLRRLAAWTGLDGHVAASGPGRALRRGLAGRDGLDWPTSA